MPHLLAESGDHLLRNPLFVFSAYYEGGGYDETAVTNRLAAEGGFILGHQIYPSDAEPPRPYLPNSTPWIRNVRVEGLRATGPDRAGIILGLPERIIEGVVFRDVSIRSRRSLLVRHADADARGLKVRPAQGSPLIEERGARVRRR
ncbi:MAG TPA: hypothetical protein VF655_13730 [Allosphingosinicella sp.]|jgi:hypothetical protein